VGHSARSLPSLLAQRTPTWGCNDPCWLPCTGTWHKFCVHATRDLRTATQIESFTHKSSHDAGDQPFQFGLRCAITAQQPGHWVSTRRGAEARLRPALDRMAAVLETRSKDVGGCLSGSSKAASGKKRRVRALREGTPRSTMCEAQEGTQLSERISKFDTSTNPYSAWRMEKYLSRFLGTRIPTTTLKIPSAITPLELHFNPLVPHVGPGCSL
jgi:hypothetical protein